VPGELAKAPFKLIEIGFASAESSLDVLFEYHIEKFALTIWLNRHYKRD
jgi:hypothetical protein